MGNSLREVLADRGPSTRAVFEATLREWPEHEDFLRKSIVGRSLEVLNLTEEIATSVLLLAGDRVNEVVAGYRWMCEMVLEEELHFRRHQAYRFSSFDEVNAAVYQQREQMACYMDGLLWSQVLWSNHVHTLDFYLSRFIERLNHQGCYLEVGPGHGLLLALLTGKLPEATFHGWDISPTSLDETARSLKVMGVTAEVQLTRRDVMTNVDGAFDGVVISEVLEHLVDPHFALVSLRSVLKDDGLIYVNVPINSPAIDHIYLLQSPEQAVALVTGAGYEVIETCFAPSSGYTLERARKFGVSVSIGMVARKRESNDR